jgi:putative phosphoesterase
LKRILLLSDTHNHLDEQILAHCREADEIWHAGDIGTVAVSDRLAMIKPLKAVWGNIDNDQLRLQFEEFLLFSCEKVKVMITHIAGPFGKYSEKVRTLLKEKQPDLLICGHSHVLKVQRDPAYSVLYINPGAAGHHGFHQVRTMIRFSIDESKVLNMEVIELGKRGRLTQPVS